VAPRGVIECILLKDVVDYIWEARRFRRLKVAAVHASMPAAASRILSKDYCGGYYRDASHIKDLARAAATGADDGNEETLASRAEENHVTSEVIHYSSYTDAASEIFDISREVERLERRRDQLLKQLEDRRTTLAAMARGLIRREEAETVELRSAAA
jgi:valyl-tRNA synthetase